MSQTIGTSSIFISSKYSTPLTVSFRQKCIYASSFLYFHESIFGALVKFMFSEDAAILVPEKGCESIKVLFDQYPDIT